MVGDSGHHKGFHMDHKDRIGGCTDRPRTDYCRRDRKADAAQGLAVELASE